MQVQNLNENYYNLCIAILGRAEQDIKGCSVLYRANEKSMLNEIETARQSAKNFFNNSYVFNLVKDYIFLYRGTTCKDTTNNLSLTEN